MTLKILIRLHQEEKLTKNVIKYERVFINPCSAETDFSRQNLTSVDVRFWRLKSIPAL